LSIHPGADPAKILPSASVSPCLINRIVVNHLLEVLLNLPGAGDWRVFG
jgi:hypothetical protein